MQKGEAMGDLMLVIGILILIGLVWFLTGGPSRIPDNASIFLNQPEKKVSERTQDNVEEITGGSKGTTVVNGVEEGLSSYEGLISISTSRTKGNDINKEYITLNASGSIKEPINITGWTLKNSTGNTASIGQGEYLPSPGHEPINQAIVLRPRDKVIVITGRSPIGINFRTNRCTGYFAKSTVFEPTLSKQCPYLRDETVPQNLGNNCLDFIESLGRCVAPGNSDFEGNFIEPMCREFILQNTGYGACVNLHKNDSNFVGNEWRVFLNRGFEMWASRRETITLFDNNGNVVDSTSY